MKTIPPALPKPPRLPRPKKTEEFPPINFNVLHGRVIECFEAKIPIVHGGGGARHLHLEISDSYNSRFLGMLWSAMIDGGGAAVKHRGYSDDQPPTVPEINEAISIGEPHWP